MNSLLVAQSETFVVVLGALAVLVAYIATTSYLHLRRLRSIPIRIHVAGTRGKSSTTRFIAAGLRSGGLHVLAKTTGTQPRLIGHTGAESPWRRRGLPSIREQARFIALASRARADAVVVECMAIKPELVWASERYFLRATTCVITNVRPDHLEELGGDAEAVAEGLSGAVPTRSKLVVSDEAASPAILDRARLLGTAVTSVRTMGLPPLDANRELALHVCESLGVPPSVATRGMLAAPKDPGAFSVRRTGAGGKPILFANAFSCNDVESFRLLWNDTYAEQPAAAVVFMNVRHDRPLRTGQFLAFLATLPSEIELFLASDRSRAAGSLKRLARKAGFPAERINIVGSVEPSTILTQLAAASQPGGIVWGVGNFRGLGQAMGDFLGGEDALC